jgi:hypothetical protein
MPEVLYATGMRRNEMARLETGDLDLARDVVLIRQGKGGKDRLIPLGERAALGRPVPRSGPAAAGLERTRCHPAPGPRGSHSSAPTTKFGVQQQRAQRPRDCSHR